MGYLIKITFNNGLSREFKTKEAIQISSIASINSDFFRKRYGTCRKITQEFLHTFTHKAANSPETLPSWEDFFEFTVTQNRYIDLRRKEYDYLPWFSVVYLTDMLKYRRVSIDYSLKLNHQGIHNYIERLLIDPTVVNVLENFEKTGPLPNIFDTIEVGYLPNPKSLKNFSQDPNIQKGYFIRFRSILPQPIDPEMVFIIKPKLTELANSLEKAIFSNLVNKQPTWISLYLNRCTAEIYLFKAL